MAQRSIASKTRRGRSAATRHPTPAPLAMHPCEHPSQATRDRLTKASRRAGAVFSERVSDASARRREPLPARAPSPDKAPLSQWATSRPSAARSANDARPSRPGLVAQTRASEGHVSVPRTCGARTLTTHGSAFQGTLSSNRSLRTKRTASARLEHDRILNGDDAAFRLREAQPVEGLHHAVDHVRIRQV